MQIKIRKNSKAKLWNVYTMGGTHLGRFFFHTAEVKAYFPGCTIRKQDVILS